MSRVVFSPLAQADLDEILEYIARDKPQAAASFVAKPKEKCYMLGRHPQLGERRPEFKTGQFRGFHVGNYVIFFRPADDGIEIARVVSGFRDLRYLF